MHRPLQLYLLPLIMSPVGKQAVWASVLFASPKHASAMTARPTPNFFSAARRVTDWAMLLVSSSNWLFMFFLSSFDCESFCCLLLKNDRVNRRRGVVLIIKA